jgi:hypothetical protein
LRLRKERDRRSRLCDRVLLAAWALTIAAFLLIGGPQAMTPGQERFAICLIAPTVLLLARGAALLWEAAGPRWRVALAVATLAGWPLLADFHAHYFRFIEQTGGQSHMTFRTANIEPKRAALQYILENAGQRGERREERGEGEDDGKAWIVCSAYWNRWPIRYLALHHRGVRVPEPEEIAASEAYRRALVQGQVWFVEFRRTPEFQRVESQFAGRNPTRQEFLDFGHRPVLCVLHGESP